MDKKPLTLLLVEDDIDVAASIGDYFEAFGFLIDFAYSYQQALHRVRHSYFDLLILDVNLPDKDGFSLCQELKIIMGVPQPVLFLTARDSLSEKLKGFELGAADYVVKPFSMAELKARVLAILNNKTVTPPSKLTANSLSLDTTSGTLTYSDQMYQLQSTGLTIMTSLLSAYPNAVAKKQLYYDIWGEQIPSSDPLRAHIHQLRTQLKSISCKLQIETVTGIGYRLGPIDNEAQNT